jgi:hypothetical protein
MGGQFLDWPAVVLREAVELAAGVAGEEIGASLDVPVGQGAGQGRRKISSEAAGKLGEAEAAGRRRFGRHGGRLSGRCCDYSVELEIVVFLGGLPGADCGVHRFGGRRW